MHLGSIVIVDDSDKIIVMITSGDASTKYAEDWRLQTECELLERVLKSSVLAIESIIVAYCKMYGVPRKSTLKTIRKVYEQSVPELSITCLYEIMYPTQLNFDTGIFSQGTK